MVIITGIGAEAAVRTGIINVRIDLLPALEVPLSTTMIGAQLQKEKIEKCRQRAEFILYSKTWWEELQQKHVLSKQSMMKLFALSETYLEIIEGKWIHSGVAEVSERRPHQSLNPKGHFGNQSKVHLSQINHRNIFLA